MTHLMKVLPIAAMVFGACTAGCSAEQAHNHAPGESCAAEAAPAAKKAVKINTVAEKGTTSGLLIPEGCVHPPTLDGGFWQILPEVMDRWTDEKLEEEVKIAKRDSDMNILIVQYGSMYDHAKKTYLGYTETTAIPTAPEMKGRDPLGALLRGADAAGVKVVLGGPLLPLPFEEGMTTGIQAWMSPQAIEYRRQMLGKYYSKHPSLWGYYTPNEPNFDHLKRLNNGATADDLLKATQQELKMIRKEFPRLKIVKSIGLYAKLVKDPATGKDQYQLATPATLDPFWRPWVKGLPEVDVWMVIDGIGTLISDPEHSDAAQKWARGLAKEFGKEYWTDVENCWMGRWNNQAIFTIDELKRSLNIAAKHADKTVTFDYMHYQSALSYKPEARKLHKDYAEYYKGLKAEAAKKAAGADPNAKK